MRVGISGTAVLSLLLGIAAPAYAQQEQHGEKQDQAKPEQHAQQPQHAQAPQRQAQQQPQHAQPPQRQAQQQSPHAQPPQRQAQRSQPQHAQQQQAQQKQQPQRTQQQQHVEQSAWQQHRASNWQSDHRTWQQRGGYHGYHIPDDRFLGYFGSDHGFRISGLPFLVVGGFPRFQYQGYWFSAVDPWPEYWGDDWYNTDDVYVVYTDSGYYLYDRRYPNAGVAISISM